MVSKRVFNMSIYSISNRMTGIIVSMSIYRIIPTSFITEGIIY